jgi:hypothetical protein
MTYTMVISYLLLYMECISSTTPNHTNAKKANTVPGKLFSSEKGSLDSFSSVEKVGL